MSRDEIRQALDGITLTKNSVHAFGAKHTSGHPVRESILIYALKEIAELRMDGNPASYMWGVQEIANRALEETGA